MGKPRNILIAIAVLVLLAGGWFFYQSAESEKQGYWSLYSVIFSVNEASIRLHQKCGFRVIGYREKIAKDRFGSWQNTTVMEKRSALI